VKDFHILVSQSLIFISNSNLVVFPNPMTKRILFLFILLSVFQNGLAQTAANGGTNIIRAEFGHILDSLGVKGSLLVYDAESRSYYSNDFDWASEGFIPASTFKIANGIIAVETGVVKDESIIFKWDGQKRALANWEQDLSFKQAFQFSCVPCFQELARTIGEDRMKRYLAEFEYGQIRFVSSEIDSFWLRGESRISQFEQIAFLERFYFGKLGVSDRTTNIMKKVMLIDDSQGQRLSGKTGLGRMDDTDIGWIVGYQEIGDKVYFFATNIQPKDATTTDFNAKRLIATKLALELMYR
jgi:beta-lactamase class D OXA-209